MIDGNLVIDSWKRKATRTDFAEVELEAGKSYDLKAEYFVKREATAKLYWKAPDVKRDYTELFAGAKKCAQSCELTVAVLGMNKNFESEGQDRETIRLSVDQEVFIQEIFNVNPRTVVVLVAGSSLAIGWINDHIPAIVEAWYPGEQGGNAVAEVLFGDYNPAGRLPLTFYNSLNDLPAFDNYDITNGRTYQYFKGKPLYPFGYGLSYSGFSYRNLNIQDLGAKVKVSFQLKNSGKVDGDEVAQVYVRFPEMNIPIPVKQLKGFKRVNVNLREIKTVEIEIDKAQLRYWDENQSKFVTPKGTYTIMVGASSEDIRLTKTLNMQ
jgi:beta-glucosidase